MVESIAFDWLIVANHLQHKGRNKHRLRRLEKGHKYAHNERVDL